MKVAVTGASGFIGQALVAGLRAAGHEARPLSRSGGADFEDFQAAAKGFMGADAVVHLAARAHRGGGDADFEPNVEIVRVAAKAARDAGVQRFVLVSSIGVNGNVTRDRPFTESDAPAPVEPYARSKWRAEQEVKAVLAATSTAFVIVRPPLVHGPNAPGNFGKLVRVVARGLPLPLASVRNFRSLVGIDNLVQFLLTCLVHPAAKNELFLVADGEDLSTPQIIRCIAHGLRQEARLWPMPPSFLKFAATMAGRSRIAESLCDSLQVDASKAGRMLGWSPGTPATVGIERAASAWKAVR